MLPMLEALLRALPPDASTLLRSLRQRMAAVPGVPERFEPRGTKGGEVVLVHAGVELARLSLRAGAYPRLCIAGSDELEIRGLPQAATAAARLRELAEARAARLPQLDLFGRRP